MKTGLRLFDPSAPMGRADVDLLLRFGILPSARNPLAGEDERVGLVFLDDGELKIALERCCGYRLPHEALMRL
jgi:hypothetical protein